MAKKVGWDSFNGQVLINITIFQDTAIGKQSGGLRPSYTDV